MSAGGPFGRLSLIAFLVISLLVTALQAKLGWYHPEQSQVHLISEEFKPSECRMDRAVPVPPVAIVAAAITAEAPGNWHPEPDSLEYVPPQPRPPLLSSSHWYRPPPARS